MPQVKSKGCEEIDTACGKTQIRRVDETPKPEPRLTAAAMKARAEREARQAAALRANLRRRKEQARGRDAGDSGATGSTHAVYPDISE
jgi:hypothetical protein